MADRIAKRPIRVDADYVKMAYRNLNGSDGHWFDRDTMRFFNTRIGESWRIGNVFLFVTSEQPPHGDRAYSVRRMGKDGDVQTLGEFCQIETRRDAIKALRDAVADAQEGGES
jgi:hypothetical protein